MSLFRVTAQVSVRMRISSDVPNLRRVGFVLQALRVAMHCIAHSPEFCLGRRVMRDGLDHNGPDIPARDEPGN